MPLRGSTSSQSALILFVAVLAASVARAAQAPTTASRVAAERIGSTVLSARTERLATDRAKLAITPSVSAAANLKLMDDTGKEVAATRTANGTLEAVVDPRRSYVLAAPLSSWQRLSKDGQHFPARYVTIRPDGTTRVGGLFLRPARVPLTWSDTERAYTTDLFIGYEFPDGAEAELKEPKTVTFFVEGSHARIKEDRVRIDHSGGGGYKRVTLWTDEVERETQFVARVSANDELKSSVGVLREAGALQLSLPSFEIPAFGVGSTTLAVSLLGRDGRPLAATAPLEVQLSSRRLKIPPAATIPAGKSSVEVDVRSTGSGADEIKAQSGTLRAAVQPVRLIFPIQPIVAAVLGGALGGAARFYRNRGKQRGVLVRRIIEGVLVGIILVGAAWTGLVTMEMSTGVLGTPFGAFVLAALGGYVGCALLDRVTKKTFAGVKLPV